MKIESDQILALAEAVAHVGHWSWNFDTQEVFWSPECFNIFGRDPETWIPTGENFRDDMPDEDREKLEEANLRGFESGASFQLEYRYFRGGSRDDVRWIRVFCDFLVDASGTNHMVGIAQDITENKLLVDRLREKTLQLSKAQEISKVGHWNLDAATMEVSGSDELFAIFGIGRDEATLDAFVDVVHPEDREYDVAHIQRGLETGQSWDIEHRLLCRDGSIKHIRAAGEATVNEEGGVESLFGTIQDITDRVEILKALQESEERFRSIIESSPVPLIITRRSDGNILYANPKVGPAFGLATDEVIGRSVTEFYWDSSGREDRLAALEKHGYVRDNEVDMRKADGSPISIIHSLQVIEYQGEEAVLGGFYDITERKQAEQEIQRLNEDLERRVEERTADLRAAQDTLIRNERLSTLGQLTATVSHELRNPLGVIRTSAFTLQTELSDKSPRVARALERIDRTVVRCDRIIDELLDFTRISRIEPEPTSIDAWLEKTLNEQTLPSGIALRLGLDKPNMAVPFDHDRFRRAIINVFDNACQAMTGDGMEDADSEEHTLTVRTQEHDGRVEVIFEDTGLGIPPDVYERIFEPLFSTKGFGVGLGLPVVKQIMEQHGGGIEIESEEGRGTRVCLWLPTGHSTH